jgi:2,5-diamino-6-(ribosylamino)-4(3H)-pyrimidinone 5'-phosphate reductase
MGRPYVLINVAATVDGKIDTIERQGAAISSEADRQRVDALRASVDAVLVGGRTLLQEDPRLTVKSSALRAERLARGETENPAKVGVVSQPQRLRANGRFLAEGNARIILFCPLAHASAGGPTPDHAAADALAATPFQPANDALTASPQPGAQASTASLLPGVEIFRLGNGRVDLTAAMERLAALGMRRVLVEGGGTLNSELLRLGLVDEVQLFLAPRIFGGATAPTLADGDGGLSVHLALSSVEAQDNGVLLRYKVKPS